MSNATQKKQISRRTFMASAAAVAAFTIVPRHVLGGPNYVAPSEKLNIAAIGAGGMGSSNLNAMSNENIVALCDVDFNRAAGSFKKYPKAKQYKDFRVMLEKQKDIDAVLVATPDHIHAVAAMAAIKADKHVYVQKPLTYTVKEARMLTEAAREHKVATQMGNQGHSGEGARLICEWVADGAIGDVKEVHCWTNRPVWPQGIGRPTDTPPVPSTLDWDLWLGPAPHRPYHPTYLPFNWRAWLDFGCGALGDMACHIMDAAFWSLKLKYPTSVQASVSARVDKGRGRVKNTETYPDASIVHYKFPAREGMSPVKVHWYDGGILPERPDELDPRRKLPQSGTIMVGENGSIMCDTYGGGPRIFPETKMKAYKRPAKTIARVNGSHEQNWIDACKGGPAACSNFDYSGPFTETVLLGNLAVRNPEKKLEWDGENIKVTNFDEANALVHRQYRQGWTL
ncbi:MAG: Gfo/Idh/MocA family oxidoreductase [Anaerohalosphaera sp.]|nr:Gfo/Idh/MocA family oxidoreductase [Anaerohalosphaera sp.]